MPFSLPWVKLIGAAAVLLAVFLAWRWFTGIVEENATLKRNNDALTVSLESEKAAREELDKERAKADRIVADGIARGMERAASLNSLKREVANAPPVKDGCSPWGPASDIVIRRLQQRTGDSQAGTDPAKAPAGNASLRPGP